MLEEVKKHRSKVERLAELLDKLMYSGMDFETGIELVDLLRDRYRYASTLAEKMAISSLLLALGEFLLIREMVRLASETLSPKSSDENGGRNTNT